MKTAVSLPDDVFRAAERHARRARKSRSQLYAEALSEYLSRHAPDEVTEAMNQVIDQLHEPPDPFVATAARRILERTEWSPCRRERSGGQICPSPPARLPASDVPWSSSRTIP